MDALYKRLVSTDSSTVELIFPIERLALIDDLTMFAFHDADDHVHYETIHQRVHYPQSGTMEITLSPTQVANGELDEVVALYLGMGWKRAPKFSYPTHGRGRVQP